MKKKYMIFLLIAVLVLGIVGCKNDSLPVGPNDSERNTDVNVVGAGAEISYYARKIPKEEIMMNKSIVSVSYIQVVSKKHKDKLTEYEKQNAKVFPMGKCIIYYRSITREESSSYDSYTELLEYLKLNKLDIRGDILLLPTFLSLEEDGYDIEKLLIPIS